MSDEYVVVVARVCRDNPHKWTNSARCLCWSMRQAAEVAREMSTVPRVISTRVQRAGDSHTGSEYVGRYVAGEYIAREPSHATHVRIMGALGLPA